MRYVLIHILLLICSLTLGQEPKSILNPSRIKVGEFTKLQYSFMIPSDAVFKHNEFPLIIPSRKKESGSVLSTETSTDVEQTLKFSDTIIPKGNMKLWIGTYNITAWNEGVFVIPGGKLLVNDSTFEFPEVELTVELVKAKKNQDIYDIEESYSELPDAPNPFVEFLKKYAWLIGFIAFAIFVWLYIRRRKKRTDSIKPVKEMSLKERSLLAIDLLEKERLWEKGKLKEHYIELSFILRSYLSSRYEINLLENTTKEAQLLLSHKDLHPETIKVIGTVLDQSDMVKFARSAPEEMEVLKISQLVRQVIAETSPIEFEHGE